MILPPEARAILARLELVSHGSTQSWNSSGGRDPDRDPRPSGESFPPHLEFRKRMEAEPWNVYTLIREAQETLNAIVKGSGLVGLHTDEAAWVLEDGAGHDPDAVARKFGWTVGRVMRERAKHGLDPLTGGDPGQVKIPVDQRTEAKRLAAQGLNRQQIAARLKVDRVTVWRWLGNARNAV